MVIEVESHKIAKSMIIRAGAPKRQWSFQTRPTWRQRYS
jgi:hypothetical protein